MSEELQMGKFLLFFKGILTVMLRKPLDFAFGFGVSWNSKPSSMDVSKTIPGQVLQVTAVFQKSCWVCSKIQIFNILLKENHLMNLRELVATSGWFHPHKGQSCFLEENLVDLCLWDVALVWFFRQEISRP